MNPGETARLRNLCFLFRIPIECTQDNPPAALSTLSYLYAMPAISDHAKRRQFGNDILQSTRAHFMPSDGPRASEFFARVQGLVIEMQEFPAWFSELSQSPEDLVRAYQRWALVIGALKFIGIGAGSSAIAAGIKEALKAGTATEMAKAQVKTTLGRLAGRGAVVEGIEIRFGKGLPLQPALAIGIIAATALYFAAEEEMRKLRIVILDKFQNGQISKELFSQVFKEVDPSDIKKYWEMR
jgi:hypothetical protein